MIYFCTMKHNARGKAKVGPGGIKCPCCTKGRPSYTKRLAARYNRREAKRSIRNGE